MKAADRRVYLAVAKRADGRCEACREWKFNLQMDHAFGRAKAPTSVETVWSLCAPCHQAKTDNYPSAAHWLGVFAAFAHQHGYEAEADRAEVKLAVLLQKGLAF